MYETLSGKKKRSLVELFFFLPNSEKKGMFQQSHLGTLIGAMRMHPAPTPTKWKGIDVDLHYQLLILEMRE